VKHNLTLTLDSDLLRAARRFALERDTSVNQLVREHLAHLVQQTEDPYRKAAAEFRQAAQRSPARLGKAKWTREQLHDRSK
jgi:protein-tyrosine-phosphatase